MADIESAYYSLLNSNDAINNFFENIEPLKRTDPLPMLAYQFISHPDNYVAKAKYPRVQHNIWGERYSQIKQGKSILVEEIHDWRGNLDGIPVKNIVKIGDSEREEHNDDLEIWRQIIDFRIIYQN